MCADSNFPALRSVAPVNAPFSCPKSSLSRSASLSAAQFKQINERFFRSLASWIALATSSFPTPLSPRMSTVALVEATLPICPVLACSTALEPTMRDSSPSRRFSRSISSAVVVSFVERIARAVRFSIATPSVSHTAITNSRSSRVVSRSCGFISRWTTPTAFPPDRTGAEILDIFSPAFCSVPPPNFGSVGATAASNASSLFRAAAITPCGIWAIGHDCGNAATHSSPLNSRPDFPSGRASRARPASSTIPFAAPTPWIADSSAN